MGKLRKGMVRVQLTACSQRLEDLETAGYGPVMVYETLIREGLINMSYGGFYSHRYRSSAWRPPRGSGRLAADPSA